MKTFKDLKFKPHHIAKSGIDQYKDAKQAKLSFRNKYGVSVIFGSCFYSNGIDTYEVAITYDGEITYSSGITNDVVGYITSDKVTEIMKQVQSLR